MEEQGEFFKGEDYDARRLGTLNFQQFYKAADVYHSTRLKKGQDFPTWDPNYQRNRNAFPISHAGTEQAANERLVGAGQRTKRRGMEAVMPLMHTGEFATEHAIEDRGEKWSPVSNVINRTGKSFKYVNRFEDAGSLSIIGRPSSFQDYQSYLRTLPTHTAQQKEEMKSGVNAARNYPGTVDQSDTFKYDVANTPQGHPRLGENPGELVNPKTPGWILKNWVNPKDWQGPRLQAKQKLNETKWNRIQASEREHQTSRGEAELKKMKKNAV